VSRAGAAELDDALVAVGNGMELFVVRNNPFEKIVAKLLFRRRWGCLARGRAFEQSDSARLPPESDQH
jgi:hypothetical protein